MPIYDPRFVAGPLHKRSAVNRSVDWVSGEFPSSKRAMDYRMVRYDGVLGREFVLMQEHDTNVLAYWERPFEIRYSDGVRWRKYTPKFSIDLADTRRICVEIGWTRTLAKSRFFERFPHIRRAILKKDYDGFEVWTEKDVGAQPWLANAELVSSERTFVSDEEQERAALAALMRLGGRATVRDLRAASGVGAGSFRAVVRLVAFGHARLARPDLVFDDHAVVEIPYR